MTETEINTLPAFGLTQYVEVVTAVQTVYPDATDDTELCRRVVADTLKVSRKAGSLVSRNPALGSDWETFKSLTRAEKILVFFNQGKAKRTRQAADAAQSITVETYPTLNQHNTIADAFRHALWNILMAKRVDAKWAERYANAHEERSEAPQDEKAMDLHNNYVGRQIYGHWPTEDENQLLQRLKGHVNEHPYKRIAKPEDIGTTERLVYLTD